MAQSIETFNAQKLVDQLLAEKAAGKAEVFPGELASAQETLAIWQKADAELAALKKSPTADTATGTPNQSVSQSVPATAGAVTSEEAVRLDASAKNLDPQQQVQSALPTWGESPSGLLVSSDDAAPDTEAEGEVVELGGTVQTSTTGAGPTIAKSFTPIINPLHQYATYTYNLSLHILPDDVYKKLMEQGLYTADQNRVLIASAGRFNDQTFSRNAHWKEDFYFETLKMTTVMGMNSRTKGSNSIDMSFTIIEPYGISLLDRLMKTCDDLKLPNYIAVPYLLQIDFFGSDGKTYEPAFIEKAQRRFPIRLVNMTVNFDQRGTVYGFSAVPYSHSALQELSLTLPTTTTIRTDANRRIADFFSSNLAEVESLQAGFAPAIEQNKERFISQAIAAGKKAQDDYQKKLPAFQKAEAESRARDAAANTARRASNSAVPAVESKVSSIPAPPNTVTPEIALQLWERRLTRAPVLPTSLGATGLGTVLTAYNKFLQDEYELAAAPLTYQFRFEGAIENATIAGEKLTAHDVKPLANKPMEKNPEVLNSRVRVAETNLNQAIASNAAEAQLIPLRAALAQAKAALSPTVVTKTDSTAMVDCSPASSVTADASVPVVGAATSQQYAGANGVDVVFNQGTSILTVINDIMKSSSYITEQLKEELDNEMAKNPDADIKKIQASLQAYDHFKIIPSVELGAYDAKRDDYAKTITFTIKPYKMHGIRYPSIKAGTAPAVTDCVKEYNYLFTGKNTDILDLKINFDTLFFTAVSARVSRLQQSDNAASGGPGQESTTKSDAAPTNQILSKQSKVFPASLKFTPNTPGAMKLTQESIEAMRANDLFSNIYGKSSADMLTVDLEIVGDPGYLQQEEFTINPQRSGDMIDETDLRVNKDGSLIMTDQNLLVKLNFKFPLDIDTTTGLYRFTDDDLRKGDNNTFTGIYKILTIDNTFEHGVFKQKLNMVRVYNDSDAQRINNQKNAKLKPNVTTSDQRPDAVDLTMAPQLPVNLTMGPQLPTGNTQLFAGQRLDLSNTVLATTKGRAGDIDPVSGNQTGAVTGIVKLSADGRSPAQQWRDRNAASAVKAAEAARIKAAEQGKEPGPGLSDIQGA